MHILLRECIYAKGRRTVTLLSSQRHPALSSQRQPALTLSNWLNEEHGYGHCSICVKISVHILRPGRTDSVSRYLGDCPHADRYLPGDPDSGRQCHLGVHRSKHAGDGAARQHIQPIRDQHERRWHQEYGSADAEWYFCPEDLLSTGRQYRPSHRTDRFGYELYTRAHANWNPGANSRDLQCFKRSGPAAQPGFRQSQRAEALRLWLL